MSNYDEPFEEFDEHDADAEYSDAAGHGDYPEHESTLLLRRAIDIIRTAKPLPLSSSVRIEPEEVLELLERAAEAEPEEMRQARWLLKERQEFLDKVKKEADEIIDDARARAAQLVSRQEIVKEARRKATKLVDDAEADARRRKHEAEDWCDQQLATLELYLDKIGKTTRLGRERLRAKLEPVAQQSDGLDLAEDETSAAFFDQDR
jgi:selenocysteine-specific translation elongation factor